MSKKVLRLENIKTKAAKSIDRDEIEEKTLTLLSELVELQKKFTAEAKKSLLIIIQGMDASGKDGLTRDVMGVINPSAMSVVSFKKPTKEELAHDFLWRVHPHTPGKGRVTVFNRSHYEDVLVTRVLGIVGDKTAKQRMKSINDFEKHLQANGTEIVKIYLHTSKKEQEESLMDRVNDPTKYWKHNDGDWVTRESWDQYQEYYEEVFEKCSKVNWHIIPSDQNWYKEYLVAKLLVKTLKNIDPQYPALVSERFK